MASIETDCPIRIKLLKLKNRKFIESPIFKTWVGLVSLSIVLFLFNACSSDRIRKLNSPLAISAEEHAWMEKFFRYLMLHETAIYTLLGSKPLTSCYIFSYDRPEHERREEEKDNLIYFLLNRDDERDMAFYRKLSPTEKQNAHLVNNENYIYDFEHLWNRWEKIQDRFPLKQRYLLVKKPISSDGWEQSHPGCKEIYQIIFADVLKVALVMQQNYELFKNAVGADFDPLALALDLENESSPFWNKISDFSYSYLWGLLYGFGLENSYFYFWKWRHLRNLMIDEREKYFAKSLNSNGGCDGYPLATDKDAFTISNFPTPCFATFSEDDPIKAKYLKEKKKIQELYKGKDFVTCTLELLVEAPEI